jgi:hypothetical protein
MPLAVLGVRREAKAAGQVKHIELASILPDTAKAWEELIEKAAENDAETFKVTVAPDSKLTKAQIAAIAAKLSANGLAPGTPVYDLSDPDADED